MAFTILAPVYIPSLQIEINAKRKTMIETSVYYTIMSRQYCWMFITIGSVSN